MRFPALLLAAATMFPMPLQAGSSGCGPTPPIAVAAEQAGAVFVGQARDVSPSSDTVIFDVDWQWKGRQMPATVEVQVAAVDELAASAASRKFETGRTYLVFTEDALDPFVVDGCSASAPYGDGSVIPPNLWEALGNSQPQLPTVVSTATRTAKPPTFNAMGAAALVGLTVLLVGRLVWRAIRKRQTEGPRPFKMRRSDRAWLEEQDRLESSKPSYGERELEKQREVWRKKRRKRIKAAARAEEATERQRASAPS